MQLGRALSRAEGGDPRFKGLAVRFGNGLYLKPGVEDPAATAVADVPAQSVPSIAEQFAAEFARFLPEQSAIPSFADSGLFNEADAGKSYDQYFGGYNQRQTATLDQEKQRAQEAFQRTLASLGDTAAANEQTGSGADLKARELATKGYQQVYENPLGDFQSRVQNTRDTQTLSRADYLQKLKDEAFNRYKARFNNQATY